MLFLTFLLLLQQATSGKECLDFENVDSYISQYVIESSNRINREFEQRLRARQTLSLKKQIPRTNKMFLANTLRSTGQYNELVSRRLEQRVQNRLHVEGGSGGSSTRRSPSLSPERRKRPRSRCHRRSHGCSHSKHRHRRHAYPHRSKDSGYGEHKHRANRPGSPCSRQSRTTSPNPST